VVSGRIKAGDGCGDGVLRAPRTERRGVTVMTFNRSVGHQRKDNVRTRRQSIDERAGESRLSKRFKLIRNKKHNSVAQQQESR